MIFHSWRALNSGANVNGVGLHSCDCLRDILVGQAAGENQESCEGTGGARSQPITRQASATMEVRMVRVDQNVAIAKQGDFFVSELRIRRERPDDTKFTS
jgi:hypothetical protein